MGQMREGAGVPDVVEHLERIAGNGKGKRGRIVEGQEQNGDVEVVRKALDELERAWTKSELADQEYKDVVKKVAERSGFNAAAISKFVGLRMTDKILEWDRKAGQVIQLCLDLGERTTS